MAARKAYHTQGHLTVAVGLCSTGSLDRNLGNAPDSMDSATAGLGQAKTSGKKVKTRKSYLSKSSRLPSWDREERVGSFSATDISDTRELGKTSGI